MLGGREEGQGSYLRPRERHSPGERGRRGPSGSLPRAVPLPSSTAPRRRLLLPFILVLGLAAAHCAPAQEGDRDPKGGPTEEPDGAGAASPRPGDPPTARRETLEALRETHVAARHPSDGGGKAWIEAADVQGDAARVGGLGRWTILYEAGPEGIAVGGAVRLIVSPFWDWSPAQARVREAPGYTEVESLADGVELRVHSGQWLEIEIEGRPLAAGEQLRLVYGAGPAGARVDGYAEREEHFWIAVDGDGDGIHRVLVDSPTIDVEPGPPRRLNLILPSTARPGAEVELRLAVLDRVGNTGCRFTGTVELASADPEAVELPASVRFEPEHEGRLTVKMCVKKTGVVRLAASATPDDAAPATEGTEGEEAPPPIIGESNPLVVDEASPRILWGDLHGHSNLSDGTGTPEDYMVYARDVAGLDVAALTDHDHWGMLFLDEQPGLWERIQEVTKRFHEPGRFVTVLGYEWTNWLHGHRHVLHFEDAGRILSSIDPAYETPAQLWSGLRADKALALTFAHHSAGGPIATNWDYAPDPEFEPVTEVASVHGSSEAPDSPHPIYSPLAGNFVRDALGRGYRLGFIGSGDSHDGHPGLAQLASGKGGLAAIFSEELTREGVLEALRTRRVYATNGARIVLRCAFGPHRMGATIPAAESGGKNMLFLHAIGTDALAAIDVVRSGEIVQTIDAEGAWDFTTAVELEGFQPGEYLYVRVIQADRGTAWSSPFYFE